MAFSLNDRDLGLSLAPNIGLHRAPSRGTGDEHFSDDSEAETEILNPSTNNTPVKRGLLAKHRKLDSGQSAEKQGYERGLFDDDGDAAAAQLPGSGSNSERKRKSSDSGIKQVVGGDVKRMRAWEGITPPVFSTELVAIDEAEDHDDKLEATRRRTGSNYQEQAAHETFKTHDVAGSHEAGATKANIRPSTPTSILSKESNKDAVSSKNLSHPLSPSHDPPSSSPPPSHRRSSSFHQSSTSKFEHEQKSRTRFSSHDDAFLPPAERYIVRKKRHSVRSTLSPSLSHPMAPRGEKRDRAGRTPLAQACAENNLEKFNRIFANSTADMEKTDNTGNTPLQIASLDGAAELVKRLIDAGANIHCVNSDKDTPLIDAVENSHLEVIKILLEAGIDPRVTNLNGKQPLELVPTDSEQYDEIKQILVNAIRTYRSPTRNTALLASHSETVASTSNSLLYVQPTLENLRKFSAKGDAVGVVHFLNCQIRPDNASLVAAARGGHEEVLSLLIAFGGQPDPRPKSAEDDTTPMLAAIGRGHLKVIELLLNCEGFDCRRRLNGPSSTRYYGFVARARRGPHWQEEVRLLLNAARRQRTEQGYGEDGSDDEEELYSDVSRALAASVDETVPAPVLVPASVPIIASELSEAGLPEVTDQSEHDENGFDTPAAEPRRRRLMTGHERSELRAHEERQRQEYLDGLPRVLQRTLGKHIALWEDPRAMWIKPIGYFNPIVVAELIDIDPSCPEERAGELWLINFQAALFLAHPRLDTAQLELGWETRPCPLDHRQKMAKSNASIREGLYEDAIYLEASNEQIEASGWIYTRHPFKPAHSHLLNDGKTWAIAEQKFYALPDSQIYWVPLLTFIAATVAPDMGDRYKDTKIITMAEKINDDNDRIPNNMTFKNGVMLSERPSQGLSTGV